MDAISDQIYSPRSATRQSSVELQTKVCEDITIMEKAQTRDAKVIRERPIGSHRFLKPSIGYDFFAGVPLSCLLTVFRGPFSIVP